MKQILIRNLEYLSILAHYVFTGYRMRLLYQRACDNG